MAYTLQEALDIAIEQKRNYEKNLVGKSFMYAYVDKLTNEITMKEVEFQRKNYLHLTGLDYKSIQHKKRVYGYTGPTLAEEFYSRLGTDDNLLNDVSFIVEATQQKTYTTFRHTQDKIQNLPKLTNIAKKAEYIGEYVDATQFDLVVNRSMESLLLRKEGTIYIPSSSQFGKAGSFIKQKSIQKILAIFCKDTSRDEYKIQYLNSSVNIGKKMFAMELTKKLSYTSFSNANVEFKATSLDALKQSFTASIKRNFVEKANNLSDKRKNAFENDTSLAEYEKERKIFVTGIRDNFEAEIAIDVLSKQNEEIPNELVNEEISEIRNKFQLNASTISTPNVNKHMQMSITEDKPMQIDFSMQGGAAAMTLNPQMPNNEFFTRIANAIAKGVDSLLHKKSDTKRTQVEISDRQQPTPQQSENKTSTLTKAPAPQPVPQKQSLKAMMSKAAQQKKDMAAATKSMEKWADDVQDIQQSRKNNIHR